MRMADQEAVLDATIAALSGVIDDLVATVQVVIDKLSQVHGVDLGDENAALTGFMDKLSAANDSLKGLVPVDPTPVEPPVVDEPPVEATPVVEDQSGESQEDPTAFTV